MATPEADLAKRVIAHLERQGWTIYQEVEALAGRADIVATKGSLIYVIECKATSGFEVIEQARRWVRHANLVSIATPLRKAGAYPIELDLLRMVGLGWLTPARWDDLDTYRGNREPETPIVERVAPRLWRGHGTALRVRLHPDHQSMGIAGSNEGGYFTAWKATAKRLVEAASVRGPQGATVRELVREIVHHYAHEASAVGCLTRDIDWGRIPALKLVPKDPGKYQKRRVYLTASQAPPHQGAVRQQADLV